jgi:hypothetical protein
MFFRDGPEGSELAGTSVCDQHIDFTCAAFNGCKQALEISYACYVTLYAFCTLADRCHSSIEFLLTTTSHEDSRALACEPLSNREANSAVGARHYSNLASDLAHLNSF